MTVHEGCFGNRPHTKRNRRDVDRLWTPHITLAEHDIEPENLARIITRLASRPLFWEIPVGNLAIIWDTGTQQELRYQFPFQHQKKNGTAEFLQRC